MGKYAYVLERNVNKLYRIGEENPKWLVLPRLDTKCFFNYANDLMAK